MKMTWDPSFRQKAEPNDVFVKDSDRYVVRWEPQAVVGQAMVDERIAFNRNFSINLAKQCKAPLRVVWAGDGDYIRLGESYHNHTKTQSDFKIVPGSEHCFDEPGTIEPLLNYTKEWFDKFTS